MAIEEYFKKELALLQSYNQLKPHLSAWGQFIDARLLEIIKQCGVNPYHVEKEPSFRLKTDKSLISKVFYRGKKFSDDPLLMSDKIGTRIVVTTLSDIDPIKEAILKDKGNWEASIIRNLGEEIPSHPKVFDYDSLHLQLVPVKGTEIFRSFKDSELKYYACEVQIKTLCQHAFAQLSHDTVYKGPFSESPEIIRTLSTCMALMEVVDRYFEEAVDKMNKASEKEKAFIKRLFRFGNSNLQANYKQEEIDEELNVAILRILRGTDFEIEDIEIALSRDEANVKTLLKRLDSFMAKQPILLLIAFFISSRMERRVFDSWPLDKEILEEITFKLGHAFPY